MQSLAELFIKICVALGASESKMRWRMHKLGLWREKAARKSEVKSEQIRYAHKKCRACRALCDKDDKVCDNCGEPLRWRISLMFERAGLGGVASTSALLVVLLLAAWVAAIASASGSLEMRLAIAEYGAKRAFDGDPLWSIIAHPYLHFSLVGLLGTGLAVFLLGQELEELFGRFAMVALFSVTGIAGALAYSLLFDGQLYGASPGLCGLIGLGVAAGHQSKTHAGHELRGLMIKWALVVFGVLLLMQGNIVGEIAAFAVGGAIGWTVKPEWIRLSLPVHIVVGLLGAALAVGGAALAIAELGRPYLFWF